MKARFLRKGFSAPFEVLELTRCGDSNSQTSRPAEELTFRVTRHGKVLIVSWETKALGEPNEALAKMILSQMVTESVLVFVNERGNSWHFTKEKLVVA